MIVEVLPDDAYIVLFTGDREWLHVEPVARAMETLPSNTVVVHGWAKGLDTVADIVANAMGFRVIRCPAHWRHNEPKCVKVWGHCPVDCKELEGRPAGAIRNHKMYDTYHPVKVIGFHENILESKGTKEMLKYAQKKNCETWLYTRDDDPIQNPRLTKPRESNKLPKSSADLFFKFDVE